jgi:SAM-dependent methyltransferase
MTTKEALSKEIQKLIDTERRRSCGRHLAEGYKQGMAERFDRVLDLCTQLVPIPDATILDVGRSYLTTKLANHYKCVFSMGYDLETDDGGHREPEQIDSVPHIIFDLNQSKYAEKWPNYPGYFDLIVIGEVIEHIFTAPEFTLFLLRYLLKPGGFIILTTPNALRIDARLKLMLGTGNPYERLRYYDENPGHYREYSKKELIEIGKISGLETKATYFFNCFDSKYLPLKVLKRLVPQCRDTIILVYTLRN